MWKCGKPRKKTQTNNNRSEALTSPPQTKISPTYEKTRPQFRAHYAAIHKDRQIKFCATRFRFRCFFLILLGKWEMGEGDGWVNFPGRGKEHACCLPLVWKETTLLEKRRRVHPPGKDLCRPKRCVRVFKRENLRARRKTLFPIPCLLPFSGIIRLPLAVSFAHRHNSRLADWLARKSNHKTLFQTRFSVLCVCADHKFVLKGFCDHIGYTFPCKCIINERISFGSRLIYVPQLIRISICCPSSRCLLSSATRFARLNLFIIDFVR